MEKDAFRVNVENLVGQPSERILNAYKALETFRKKKSEGYAGTIEDMVSEYNKNHIETCFFEKFQIFINITAVGVPPVADVEERFAVDKGYAVITESDFNGVGGVIIDSFLFSTDCFAACIFYGHYEFKRFALSGDRKNKFVV